MLKQGVKTNIHYVLGKNTIKEALECLKSMENETGFPKDINAVIFLLHKPIGQGSYENVITKENNEFKEFIHFIDTHQFPYKIGFDSCTVPALLTMQHTDFTEDPFEYVYPKTEMADNHKFLVPKNRKTNIKLYNIKVKIPEFQENFGFEIRYIYFTIRHFNGAIIPDK